MGNASQRPNGEGEIRWLYGGVTLLVVVLFLALLGESLATVLPETDLWWMIPVLSYYLSQTPPQGLLGFLFSPGPRYFEILTHKLYLGWMDGVFQFPFRFLVFGTVFFHFANAVLVGWLGSLLGLSKRASLLAGLLFLTLFIHYHAFLWPSASQHIFAVATLLATVGLFLKTEQRIVAGKSARGLYLLGCVAMFLASFQNAALIALVLIGFHILFCSPTYEVAKARYRRWLPIFAMGLIYPISSISFLALQCVFTAVAANPLSPWLKAPGLFLGGLFALFLIGGLIRFIQGSPPQRRAIRLLFMGGGGFVLLLWILKDKRQILFPYNALVPLTAMLASLFDPLRTSLSMDVVDGYHYIPANVSLFYLMMGLFLVWVFLRVFVKREKGWRLLFLWYLLCVAYLLLHKHVASSMPFRTQSRYFVYLTPVFSLLLAAAGGTLFSFWGERMRLKPATVEKLLVVSFLALAIPNLLAIRVAMFRGKLTNTYLSYDDLRTASLIRRDLLRNETAHAVDPDSVYVRNVVPMVFSKMKWSRPVEGSRIEHENFRRLMGEVFGDRSMRVIHVNEVFPSDRRGPLYQIEGERITDGRGRSIEPFDERVSGAISLMNEGRREAAMDLFKKAVLERPFLLNYVLAPGLRLSDLVWITGGGDMRDWLEQIRGRYDRWGVVPTEKAQRTHRLIQQELSNYVLCLFCLSYLEHQAGHLEQSRFWLSQIWFIERDPEALERWMAQIPEIRSSSSLASFLEKVKDPVYFLEPLVWKKEDYAFGRFLARLILHWDIRSKWDNRFRVVL